MRAKLEAFWHNSAGRGAVRGISGKCGSKSEGDRNGLL